jgi:glycosyltransferase involved in cell wall biosynthesis
MAALEHGMAIITTPPVVPYPDLIDGEPLLFAPPQDVRATTDAVAQALMDGDLRRRLSENARALSRKFTWESIAAAHLRAYDALSA